MINMKENLNVHSLLIYDRVEETSRVGLDRGGPLTLVVLFENSPPRFQQIFLAIFPYFH